MADYEKNIDQLSEFLLPSYQNSNRASGLDVSFVDESEYVEPYSLDEFKDHAQIDFATDDNLLELYLKAARIDVENYLQKSLGIRTVNLLALTLPKNYRLPFGPVDSISTIGFSNFGDLLVEGGENINIEYVTKVTLVNDSIKQSIYKQAYNYYENRNSNEPTQMDSIVKVILNPYKSITLF